MNIRGTKVRLFPLRKKRFRFPYPSFSYLGENDYHASVCIRSSMLISFCLYILTPLKNHIRTLWVLFSWQAVSVAAVKQLLVSYNVHHRCRHSFFLWRSCLESRGGCRRARHRGWHRVARDSSATVRAPRPSRLGLRERSAKVGVLAFVPKCWFAPACCF